MDQIMLLAWEHLDAPRVRKAFARAALARLRQYDEIVRDRNSVFGASVGPSFHERVAADDRKRRGLMEEMLALLTAEEDDAWPLVHHRTPLLLPKDADWIIGKLESVPAGRNRASLAALVRRAFHG